MPQITFQPSGKTIVVEPGVRLSDAVHQAGFTLPVPCGEKGLCGQCRVLVLAGDIPADGRQTRCLPARMLAEGWRAACAVDHYGDLTLADPAERETDGVILTDFMAREHRGGNALWEAEAKMPEPSTGDQRDDVTRLLDALGRPSEPAISLALLARLPEIVRDAAFHCRVLGMGDRVLDVRDAAAAGRRKLGLAVDIGTTTLAAALCDMDDGEVLAVSSMSNPQARWGDDVISRIDYASRGPAELAEMRAAVAAAMEELSAEASRKAGLADEAVFLVASGNTVMNHLLLGVTPKALALAPFIPAYREPAALSAAELGWRGKHPPLVYTVPNISAYVGGDITAGILAHDIRNREGHVLFLDVGTNGEIAMVSNGTLYACATAAGPAFEGARISQGMRAAPGAISRVAPADGGGLEIGVVDGIHPARGICGTGLLDAVAVLLRTGAIDEGGRILDIDEAREEGVPEGIAGLLHEDDDGTAVWLERPSGRGGQGVRLTQRDVREFQLAKGAVAAGVQVLLGVAGVGSEDVDEVLLAGGFGNYLDPAAALGVGLLPAGIAVEKIRSVGNASLAGARLCLLSEEERAAARELSLTVRYIELSGREDFQDAFAEEMLFPSPDLS